MVKTTTNNHIILTGQTWLRHWDDINSFSGVLSINTIHLNVQYFKDVSCSRCEITFQLSSQPFRRCSPPHLQSPSGPTRSSVSSASSSSAPWTWQLWSKDNVWRKIDEDTAVMRLSAAFMKQRLKQINGSVMWLNLTAAFHLYRNKLLKIHIGMIRADGPHKIDVVDHIQPAGHEFDCCHYVCRDQFDSWPQPELRFQMSH